VVQRAYLSFIAALLPILTFSAVMVFVLNGLQEHNLARNIQDGARAAASAMDVEIARNLSALEALALGARLDEPDGVERLFAHARDMMAAHPDWINVVLSDQDRPVFNLRHGLKHGLSVDPSSLPPLLDPAAMREVIRAGQPVVSGVMVEPGRYPEPFVSFRVPVRSGEPRRVSHVLAVGIRAWAFHDPLKLDELQSGWSLCLIDGDLRIITRTVAAGPLDRDIGRQASPTLARGLEQPQEAFPVRGLEGAEYLTSVNRIKRAGWFVTASVPFAVVGRTNRLNLALAAGSGLLALAIAAGLGTSLIASILRSHAAEARLASLEAQQVAERRLNRIAADIPGAILRRVLHPDGMLSFPYFSEGGRSLLNLGRDARFRPGDIEEVAERLIAPEDRERWIEAIRRSAWTLEPISMEFRVVNAEGVKTWIRSIARPHREQDGTVVWDAVALDVNDLKLTQAELELRLAEKDTLLREVHHRVKNNLQAIWGVIQVERSRLSDARARDRLEVIGHRLSVLGAIHQQLYASDNLQRIDCARNLEELGLRLADLHGRNGIDIMVDADPILCDLDTALPIGLIANELINNCYRHAFPACACGDAGGGGNCGGGRIEVSLRDLEDGIELEVADDGAGMTQAHSDGIGTIIVKALAGQIDGTVSTVTGATGTTVTVLIPKTSAQT
jgi:two-component sensor histidine kinase